MTVRPAVEADLPRLMSYAEAFLSYHPVTSRFPHDLVAVEKTLRTLMAEKGGALFVHDHGVIGGVIAPLWCSPDVMVATEMFWWAERDGRALMKAFEAWASENGAHVINMIAIMGRKDVTRIYDRAGYMPAELNYVKDAQWLH